MTNSGSGFKLLLESKSVHVFHWENGSLRLEKVMWATTTWGLWPPGLLSKPLTATYPPKSWFIVIRVAWLEISTCSPDKKGQMVKSVLICHTVHTSYQHAVYMEETLFFPWLRDVSQHVLESLVPSEIELDTVAHSSTLHYWNYSEMFDGFLMPIQ